LSEIIHEQNFLLQHNDQYMVELENQLEAIAVPPPEPVIPRPAEEDADQLHRAAQRPTRGMGWLGVSWPTRQGLRARDPVQEILPKGIDPFALAR
jgi:hypothetical protein